MEKLVRIWFNLESSRSLNVIRAINIIAAAVKSSTWQGPDGIIKEGASPKSDNDGVGFKGKLPPIHR